MPTIVTRPSKYRSGTLRVLTSVALIASVARRLSAQTPDSTQFRCDGKTITAIDIQPHPPAVIGDDPSGFRRAVQHFLFQSGTTRERAIRPFILARVGQKCEDSRLPEIARVVREQPYIASVTLRAVPDGGDGVRLVFATVDEVPVIIGGGLTKSSLSNLKYGNSNIGGNGLLMSGQWRDGRAYRDALALTMRQYGLFDQPIIASLDALRSTLGGNLTVAISRPFLSDLQHIAWYAGGMHDNSYRAFVRESGPTLSLPIKRDIWAMGAVARYGWRGGGAMIGPVATYEKSRPATEAVIASDAGVIPADTSILNNLYPPFRTFRVGVAGGLRWLNYMHVTGFDALIGEQDVGRGFQVAGTVERGLSAFSATNKSSLVSIDVYTGAGTPKSFVGLAARAEELPAGGGGSWSAAVVSGRTAWYFRPSDRRTIEANFEFAGGWRPQLPLQLSLGDKASQFRGYNGAALPGGQRSVLSLEQRQLAFTTGRFAQWGTALFTELGNTWSGGVPFGETKTRASIGVGLLAAVPPKSRRMLRADIAIPVTGSAPKTWVLRVFSIDATRFFWRDPNDLAPVRAGAPASPIFGWP